MGTWLIESSFKFDDVDMFDRFGLQITDDGMPEDVLLPTIRSRKITMPMRNGAYDFGAKYYDERAITLNCVTVKANTREDAREMAYLLSKKSQLRIWNEPDKYYIGRVYQAPTLEQIRNIGNRFSLTFICDPFAYGEEIDTTFTTRYSPHYAGTAATPTKITITNTGSQTITSITIMQLLVE